MGNQGPVVVSSQAGVEVAGQGQNVATARSEQAEEKKLSVDGKKIYPTDVFADTVHLKTDLTVGSGVALTDGCVSAQHIATDAVTTEKINAGAVTATKMTVSTLSSLSANLGTVTAGTISVASGQVSIGSSTAGVAIIGNQIYCKKSGATTVLIDGDSGVLTATKFQMTADADSSVNLSQGTHVLATSITVGNTTLGDIATDASDALSAAAGALEVADGQIVGFFQTSEPASGMTFGDIWIDTDKSNPLTSTCIYRYEDADGGSQGALAWRATPTNAVGLLYLESYNASRAASVADSKAVTADGKAVTAQNTANSKITTFYQASIPTSLAAGDFWVDTDDSNKLYRAYQAGATSINATGWVLCRDAGATAGAGAVQPGGGVAVDGSKYITRIDMASGITISTATSDSTGGARTNITSNGMAIYNASGTSGTLVVQIDHTNGILVKNLSSGGSLERISVASSNNTENGYLMSHANAAGGLYLYSANSTIYIQTDGSSKGIALTTGGGAVAVSGGDLTVASGKVIKAKHACQDGTSAKGDSSFSFYAASTSGGSVNVRHTVTFKDGLITSWAAS